MYKISFTILCSLFIMGCASTNYRFPDEHRHQIRAEKREAKRCIESLGFNLKERAKELRVEIVPGQRRVPEGWVWQFRGGWVLGLCWELSGGRYRIEVAENPHTGGEIAWATVRHEMGHFWAMSNLNMYDHNPALASCFRNWRDAGVRAMTVKEPDGSILIIHYYTRHTFE